MQKLPKIHFMFQLEGNVHKIYIYDDVKELGPFNWQTWSCDESETSAKYFRDRLQEIPEGAEIELHINSNGGSVKEGTAIYNLLKQHKSKKIGIVDGVAHSIALTILQACDERIMGEGTSALLHEPWTCACGNADQLVAEAEQLRALSAASRKLYMQRLKNITEDELESMMKKETMLTPDTALEYGFIDRIEGRAEEPADGLDGIQQMKQKFQNADFKGILEEFENLASEGEPEPEQKASAMDVFFNIFS
ncbi:MAG: head maturation protease, ClpP-related [Agathobacter sp.]